MAPGRRGRGLTVLRRTIAVEHVLLNDVHASSVNPFPALRVPIDGPSQPAPRSVRVPRTMDG